MKNLNKYFVLFIWAILFSYFFNMFIPKNIFYFLIGVPILFGGSVLILFFFNNSKKKKETK